MNALDYLKTHDKRTVYQVLDRAGTNLAYFKQIAYGHRQPSPRLTLRLEGESDREMTRHDLRPDIYPKNEDAAA